MPIGNPEASAALRPTVFLSYASEDRLAAQRIRDALPGFGLEVWYDESDLVGGDAWDQKIRRQIRECDYFMPVISAHTEARHEGYFRREWRFAVERTLDMADDHVFLLPVVIDATSEAGARVPDKFRAVQWLRLADGQPNAALEALCRRVASGKDVPQSGGEPPRTALTPSAPPPRKATAQQWPPFPREEPGQRIRFGFQVAGWALQGAWATFKRLPRWLRVLVYVWAAIFLISRCTSSHESDDHPTPPPPVSARQAEKLRQIAGSHSGNWTAGDTTQLVTQLAKELPGVVADESSGHAPVLAIPFAAPAGDAAAQKLADSVFTQVYGRLAIARHGHVALADKPLPALNTGAALAQGGIHDATYVVCGAIAGSAPNQQLTVEIITVDSGSVSWSKSYPVTGADPAGIAAEVSASVPSHDGD